MILSIHYQQGIFFFFGPFIIAVIFFTDMPQLGAWITLMESEKTMEMM